MEDVILFYRALEQMCPRAFSIDRHVFSTMGFRTSWDRRFLEIVWVKRFCLFHRDDEGRPRHPKMLAEPEVIKVFLGLDDAASPPPAKQTRSGGFRPETLTIDQIRGAIQRAIDDAQSQTRPDLLHSDRTAETCAAETVEKTVDFTLQE